VGEAVLDGEVHEARGSASLRWWCCGATTEARVRLRCWCPLVRAARRARADGAAEQAVTAVGDAALRPDVTDACGHEERCPEDVSMHDLEQAWDEGYRNAET
jgi:hypothetical protein